MVGAEWAIQVEFLQNHELSLVVAQAVSLTIDDAGAEVGGRAAYNRFGAQAKRRQRKAGEINEKLFHTQAILSLKAADTLIDEPQRLHFSRVEKVASVEEDRMGQYFAGVFQIQLFEFRPLRGDHQSVAAVGHLVHVLDQAHVLQHRSGLFHGARVVDPQSGGVE